MIPFKMFFEQANEEEIRQKMNLGKEYAYFYKDKWIIDTHHKLEREFERGKSDKTEDLFKNAIDWILDNKAGKGVYLFVSESSKLGMVVEYRKDSQNRVKGNNLVIVTWLGEIKKPTKKIFTKKKSDKKVVIENVQIISDNIIYLK